MKLSIFAFLFHAIFFSSYAYGLYLRDATILYRRDTTIDPNQCTVTAAESHRSVTVILINEIDYNITYANHILNWGAWASNACDPSQSIYPSLPINQSETFSAVSDGFLTGTEGKVTFSIDDKNTPPSTFSIYWDNPFSGSNEYSVEISNTNLYDYQIPPGAGVGDNAVYQVTISKST
ncbi:11510_t:CDS:1 [Diversispora eburnea]|uniref:11510_t:CDS:1 n=1 Tax=Diversispora eburnea TaxID=1213867 RepID=A0A9N8V099_9GLOM|nr:11510_t:CDS:1 [Diversispora eburnea]